MLETSRVTAELEAARAFADKIGLRLQLELRLAYLETFALPRQTRCVLSPDHAPYSFGFVMEIETGRDSWTTWFQGALIYHGPHRAHGSGAYPTFAVTLAPTMGWSIHT